MLSKKKNHQKGFSLVELLIVIAIMGVLAVIAFNAFNGVLQNSRKKADEQQAKNIERAVRMLVTESGIPDIMGNYQRFRLEASDSGKLAFESGINTSQAKGNHETVMELVTALQQRIYVKDRATGKWNSYGPYLTNPRDDAKIEYASYAPQWHPGAGGKHVGYHLRIWTDSQNVMVNPALAAKPAELNSNYDPVNNKDFDNSQIESGLKGTEGGEDNIGV
jgi:type IV pilus assembly protein PilA